MASFPPRWCRVDKNHHGHVGYWRNSGRLSKLWEFDLSISEASGRPIRFVRDFIFVTFCLFQCTINPRHIWLGSIKGTSWSWRLRWEEPKFIGNPWVLMASHKGSGSLLATRVSLFASAGCYIWKSTQCERVGIDADLLALECNCAVEKKY